jgi:hypothetical protein
MKVVSRSTAPDWHEEFVLAPVTPDAHYAAIDVFHHCNVSDNLFIGRASIRLSDITTEEQVFHVNLTDPQVWTTFLKFFNFLTRLLAAKVECSR